MHRIFATPGYLVSLLLTDTGRRTILHPRGNLRFNNAAGKPRITVLLFEKWKYFKSVNVKK